MEEDKRSSRWANKKQGHPRALFRQEQGAGMALASVIYMTNETKKQSGRIYVEVGGNSLTFSGEIDATLETIRIFDRKTKRWMDFSRDTVKQIIWDSEPAASVPAEERRF